MSLFRRNLVVGESIGEDAESNLNEVDRLTKELDLAVLGDQTSEKELVDDASGLARLRSELVLREGLFRRFDHDFEIFKVHIRIDFANEAAETLDGFTAFVPSWNAEAREIWHLDGAPSSVNISAAFFGFRNDPAVNSSNPGRLASGPFSPAIGPSSKNARLAAYDQGAIAVGLSAHCNAQDGQEASLSLDPRTTGRGFEIGKDHISAVSPDCKAPLSFGGTVRTVTCDSENGEKP
jgi:hypothetical protein